jgi:glyoxylase-like metal-dependent hydrolase (beta-lactamase superfamily II)/8-oxo-dGTP pyrophosphatase MutT (NUDIX family)
VSTITPASSVLVARQPGSDEVYLVARSPALRFMGGMVAFPGGKVHEDDEALARPSLGLTARHVCAVRELFEETGVLLARQADGRFPAQSADLDRIRKMLLDESALFSAVLESAGWHLDAGDLSPAGHLVTPPFAPLRFDTAFFAATLPPGQEASIWPGELTEGWWASAEQALARWRQAELLLTPPTVSILMALEGRPVAELPPCLRPLLNELDRGRVPPIWFSPGVLLVPLDGHGLPPTTHTNTLLAGTGPVYLIDPGPVDPVEQYKLFEIADSYKPDAVILSHHHPDHIGAAAESAQRYNVPILAQRRTAELLRDRVRVDRHLEDGEWLDLGDAPHGRGRWAMQALHTPGHAPGHLAFYEPDYQLLLAGDMVSTLSSMVIHPGDGDLAQYLASLERLKSYPTRLLLPAHGGASTRGAALLDEAIAHRAQREKQLVDALAGRSWTLEELALELYRGFPESVLKLARWQIHSGLIKLQREGRVTLDGARWAMK